MSDDKIIWKCVVGFEGLYWVSNMGDVKSNKTTLKPAVNHGGYKRVALCKNSICKSFSVHRLVATSFLFKKDNSLIVNHIDGNKINNNINNLEWVTKKENNQHAIDMKLKGIYRKYDDIHFLTRATIMNILKREEINQYMPNASYDLYPKSKFTGNETFKNIHWIMSRVRLKRRRFAKSILAKVNNENN